jgi:hypothetical protein
MPRIYDKLYLKENNISGPRRTFGELIDSLKALPSHRMFQITRRYMHLPYSLDLGFNYSALSHVSGNSSGIVDIILFLPIPSSLSSSISQSNCLSETCVSDETINLEVVVTLNNDDDVSYEIADLAGKIRWSKTFRVQSSNKTIDIDETSSNHTATANSTDLESTQVDGDISIHNQRQLRILESQSEENNLNRVINGFYNMYKTIKHFFPLHLYEPEHFSDPRVEIYKKWSNEIRSQTIQFFSDMSDSGINRADTAFQSRRLDEDTYRSSLIYVNRLYSKVALFYDLN